MRYDDFLNIFKDSTSQYFKIKKEEYLTEGKYPIIDQGQTYIGGYTNDENLISSENLPVIVFGDHTKVFKYVDFPFAIGADGVKVLTLKDKSYNAQYYFHFLKGIQLIDAGYSRHFKYLKEKKLPVPEEVSSQLHIANILSKAESLIAQRKESIHLLDEYLKSVFLEMFGDPVRNEKGWDNVVLSEICKKIGSGSTPRGGKESYHKVGISLIRSLNVHNDEFVIKDLAFIDENQAHELRNVIIEENDVLLNITGASVARCCIVPKEILPARVNQHVSILRPKNEVLNPKFLSRMFTSEIYQQKLVKDSKSKGATREAITKEELEQMNVIAPPLELQTKFAQIVEKTEALKVQTQKSLLELENLYGSLSQKAFKGELSIKDESLLMAAEPEVAYDNGESELTKQEAFLRKLMLASHIIYELCDEPTFGHTKLMKLLYLSEQVGGMALRTNYKKFAAGPFDGKTLTLIDLEFAKNGWFEIGKRSFTVANTKRKATFYKKTDKSQVYQKYFENYFAGETEIINKLISLFKNEKTQTNEIVATLYSAWKDLKANNTIVNENSLIKGFYEFHQEKKKFSKEQIKDGYNFMMKHKIYPK